MITIWGPLKKKKEMKVWYKQILQLDNYNGK